MGDLGSLAVKLGNPAANLGSRSRSGAMACRHTFVQAGNQAGHSKEQPEMNFPHMHTALAYERQNTLLEEAQAARRAREARAYRRANRTRAVRRSPFRWVPARLAPAWSRLFTSRARSSSEAALD